MPDKSAIDEIVARFFAAFTNRDGPPQVDALYRLFVPKAVIVKAGAGATEFFDLAGFVEPRRTLLTGGAVRDFCEEEVSEETFVYANVAQRRSRYRKSWISDGKPQSGAGVKLLQFVRTPDGWRIGSLVWEDD